ncbi:flagellar assembly protein FliW [Terracoccus sp. 273MFTsu3.1]|uniref:flagellar assembly protein FliW n=1 Tax=Terracoccus sp. 273MFTsu3.1 TaxID=1172188 RepID=UPI000360B198|nr:flagellar assembly protein FliW [Terracoccus sp. 273MFTsu3.1]
MTTLVFEQPMPGLDPHTVYELDAVDGADGVFSLCPSDDPDVRLFVLEAALYAPAYSPAVEGESASIGLEPGDPARILVVATPGQGGTSVNLAAPVLVNETDGRAVQAILDGWDLRAPLG